MSRDDILSLIRKQIILILPEVHESEIQPNVKMADLGANSIDRADVVVAVMHDLNLKMPLMSFSKVKNIGDLMDVFFQALHHES